MTQLQMIADAVRRICGGSRMPDQSEPAATIVHNASGKAWIEPTGNPRAWIRREIGEDARLDGPLVPDPEFADYQLRTDKGCYGFFVCIDQEGGSHED